MMPPPPQMVPLWRLWLHAASERARAASQRTARARWGGDRATRSVDGSGDGTGVGSGVESGGGSGVGSVVGSAVESGDGSGVGSVDGSGIGRVVGSAAESDGGSGVVSRVSSARRSADNQSRLPAFIPSNSRTHQSDLASPIWPSWWPYPASRACLLRALIWPKKPAWRFSWHCGHILHCPNVTEPTFICTLLGAGSSRPSIPYSRNS